MFLGTSLRSLREEKRLTQDAVALRSGISRSALSRLESNRSVPDIETLIRVANSLDVPLPRLLIKVGIVRK
jgi:HTH-type transcriptional regulator, cell division transcriptional repressor